MVSYHPLIIIIESFNFGIDANTESSCHTCTKFWFKINKNDQWDNYSIYVEKAISRITIPQNTHKSQIEFFIHTTHRDSFHKMNYYQNRANTVLIVPTFPAFATSLSSIPSGQVKDQVKDQQPQIPT